MNANPFRRLLPLLPCLLGAGDPVLDMVPPQALHAETTWNTPAHAAVPMVLITCRWVHRRNDEHSANPVDVGIEVQRKRPNDPDGAYAQVSSIAMGQGGFTGGGFVAPVRDLRVEVGDTWMYRARSVNRDGIKPTHASPWSQPVTVLVRGQPSLGAWLGDPPRRTGAVMGWIAPAQRTDLVRVWRSPGATSPAWSVVSEPGLTYANASIGTKGNFAFLDATLAPGAEAWYRIQSSADGGATWSPASNHHRAQAATSAKPGLPVVRPGEVGSSIARVLFTRAREADGRAGRWRAEFRRAAASESEWIDLTGQPPAEGRLGGWVDAAVGPDAGLAEQVVYLRGLSSRTEYLVRLTPLDGSDEPLRGEQHTVRLTTLANGVPPPPNALRVSTASGAACLSWLNLSLDGQGDIGFWHDIASQKRVVVERRLLSASAGWSVVGGTTRPEASIWNDAGLPPGTGFAWRVAVEGPGGRSPWTDPVIAITPGPGPDSAGPGPAP